MSSVTDLVFITPEEEWDSEEYVSRCRRFEEIVTRYGYSCWPVEDHGTKCPSTAVYFVGGVNYLDHDLVAQIEATNWPTGTVLYVHHEHDSTPRVTVFGITNRSKDTANDQSRAS